MREVLVGLRLLSRVRRGIKFGIKDMALERNNYLILCILVAFGVGGVWGSIAAEFC
jgi:hypothetical protein